MATKAPILTLKRIIQEYVDSFPSAVSVEGVFLFGSHARGNAQKDSDVDIIVLSQNFQDMPFIRRLEFLSRQRRKAPLSLSVPMDIYGYTPEEFSGLENESVIMRQAKKEGKFVWGEGTD